MKFTNAVDFTSNEDLFEFKKLCVNNVNYVVKVILQIIKERDELKKKEESYYTSLVAKDVTISSSEDVKSEPKKTTKKKTKRTTKKTRKKKK